MKIVKLIGFIGVVFMLIGCGGSSASDAGNAEANASYAYVTDGTSMKVVDITDPSAPILKGSVSTGSAFKVSVSDGYAYVAEFESSDPYVSIIDIDDAATPALAAAIPKGTSFGRVSDMYIENNVAYVSDEYKGIHIVALGNGVFNPQALDGADAMAVTKLGASLYLIHQGSIYGVQKFDVTTPYVLASTNTINNTDINAFSYPNTAGTDTHHSHMEHDGTNIIVANVQDAKLKKLSGSGLGLLGEVNIGGYATALAVMDNYAYVTMHPGDTSPLADTNLLVTDDGVKMIDLSNMSIVDTKALSKASGVSAYNGKLYVTDNMGLHIYDVSSGSLVLLSDFSPGSGNDVALGK